MINMIKVEKPFSLLLLGLVFLGCGESEKEKSASVIDEAIRMELEKPDGELTQSDFQKIKKLSVYSVARPVKDIASVGKLTNLEELDFAGGDISDPTPLAKLTKLWHLQINECKLQDLSALSGLDSLEELSASGNQISDLSSLKGLKKLRTIALNNNLIKDASPLFRLKSLKWVSLKGNPISRGAIEALKKALPKCKIDHD
tara:strand:+ start:1012 stop:1614 length:603 start_codon:yes stop_codon:yes gene_type:complete